LELSVIFEPPKNHAQMKNLIFLILFFPGLSQVKAQDTLKAMRKNFSTELNINPFQGSLNFNNALQQIKVRYFLSNNMALRLALNASSKKNDNEVSSPPGTNSFTNSTVRKTSTIGLSAGIEKHFKGTKRLSPYIGGELAFSTKSSTQTIKNSTQNGTLTSTVETKIDGAWLPSNYNNGIDYQERAYTKYGVNLLSGFDFYIAKNFYFGYEFTFQFNLTKYNDIDITTKGFTDPQPPSDHYDDKDLFIGPNLLNGIRLGFVF
jgi:hypothetical protein